MNKIVPHNDLVLDLIKALMVSGGASPSAGALATYLYAPPKRLPDYLSRLRNFADGKLALTNKQAGDLLEQVAALCFFGLEGAALPLSVRVPDSQLDVLQLGSTDPRWMGLAWLLGFPPGRRNIVAECKCYGPTAESVRAGRPSGPAVEQREYARLAGLMQTSMTDSVGLGIMFSLWGGSGSGTRSPSDSRLFRIKYHARHHVPLIDVTLRDIEEACLQRGGFVELMLRKTQELSLLSAMELVDPERSPTIEDTLPEHLREALLPVGSSAPPPPTTQS